MKTEQHTQQASESLRVGSSSVLVCLKTVVSNSRHGFAWSVRGRCVVRYTLTPLPACEGKSVHTVTTRAVVQ